MINNLADVLLEKFKSGELELDLGGHYGFPEGLIDYDNVGWSQFCNKDRFIKEILGNNNWDILKIDLDRVSEILKEKEHIVLSVSYEDKCQHCGAMVHLCYDGNSVFPDNKCKHAGGLKPWTLEIDVPSGKLAMKNDMRYFIDPTEGGMEFSVNLTIGIKQAEEYYATMGMFHCFVGNTCPRVCKMPNGQIIIGNLMDYDTDELYPEYSEAEMLGAICTDLWWFSACDYDLFMKHNPDGLYKDWDILVELPEPGRYKCTSYYAANGSDDLREYAVIEKVK